MNIHAYQGLNGMLFSNSLRFIGPPFPLSMVLAFSWSQTTVPIGQTVVFEVLYRHW